MEAQLEAMNQLITIMVQADTHHRASAKPIEKSIVEQQPKLAQAMTWLAAYPDLQGLSLRKAASAAGVSLATLQRALDARAETSGTITQGRLL